VRRCVCTRIGGHCVRDLLHPVATVICTHPQREQFGGVPAVSDGDTDVPIVPRSPSCSPGPGWWIASDGKWYPPEPTMDGSHPGLPAPGWWLASDGYWYPPESATRTPPTQVVVVAEGGNGIAVSALAVGIGGVVTGLVPLLAVPAGICGLLAVVFGFIGRTAVDKEATRSGKKTATTGIVLGCIAVMFSVIGLVLVDNAVNYLSNHGM